MSDTATTRTRSRALKTAATVSLAALTVWGVAAVWAFRFPRTDPLGDTDAYYVLASSGGISALRSVYRWLPEGKPLLVSVAEKDKDFPLYRYACAEPGLDITCVHPDPVSTQGEAHNLARVARERGWRSVTVISQRSHMTRARVLMKRCWDGEVRMVARDVQVGPRVWLRALVYESGAMVKTWLTPGC
ncbi:MAG: hypothetical protein Q4F67_10185 [Propionibacteriaceae bacterium]|nr:hypothetical protein [Propionibacteriaceae bacterium]